MSVSLSALRHKPPHFLLVHASEEAYAAQEARLFLCDWLGMPSTQKQHPDLFLLEPSGKAVYHTMESIRSFIQDLALTPFSGGKRGVLIRHIERMLPSSSNALLKTLEEPPPHTVIIGTTDSLSRLLPTIRSRAQELGLPVPSRYTGPVPMLPEAIRASLKKHWPFRSFTPIFSLCKEGEAYIHNQVQNALPKEKTTDDPAISHFLEQERASLFLHQCKDFLLSEELILPHKKSAFLTHCQEVFSSLEKQTAMKDVLLLFFLFEE